jgi:hypothetical protein
MFLRYAALTLLPAALLLGGCSGKHAALPTPLPALAPTLTPTPTPSSTPESSPTSAASTEQPPAASPPAAAPTAAPPTAAAPPPPLATGTPLVSLTPLPPIISTPCKSGQVKGDRATHNLYTPGFPGYSDLRSNVDCFDSLDAAQGAGYHLPGQGG